MKYISPSTAAEAVRLAGNGTYYLAGGTDLVLQMREGAVKPQVLIDLSGIEELKTLAVCNGCLEIGSMLSFAHLGQSELVRLHAAALWQACQSMGSPQIRNQATIGGNLGNCSPAADGLPPLLALGASVRLLTPHGEEETDLAELLSRELMLPKGYLIKGFRVPLGWKSGFAKLGRREALAIARISAAVAVQQEGTEAVKTRVAFGAVGKRAFLSWELSNKLQLQEMDRTWLETAKQEAQRLIALELGSRASASYKRSAVAGVIEEAVLRLGIALTGGGE